MIHLLQPAFHLGIIRSSTAAFARAARVWAVARALRWLRPASKRWRASESPSNSCRVDLRHPLGIVADAFRRIGMMLLTRERYADLISVAEADGDTPNLVGVACHQKPISVNIGGW